MGELEGVLEAAKMANLPFSNGQNGVFCNPFSLMTLICPVDISNQVLCFFLWIVIKNLLITSIYLYSTINSGLDQQAALQQSKYRHKFSPDDQARDIGGNLEFSETTESDKV